MTEPRGELGLRDVVGARAAAAPIRLHERNERELRDRREQRTRLHADALAVDEVARIVVCRREVQGPGRLAEADRGEIFRRVLHPRAEALASLRPLRLVLEKPAVLLQVRAAARG